jgi:GLPGLI family protein
MIKLLTTLILFCSLIINGQNFTGKAIYKTSIKSSFSFDEDENSTMSDDMKKQLQAQLHKMNQKTFILNFDQKTSSYKEEITLDVPKPQVGGGDIVMMSFGGSGNASVYFKNIKEKRFSNQTEIMGKRFLVKDKLLEYKWELSSETKNIGTYTCYKATFSKEVENKNAKCELQFECFDNLETIVLKVTYNKRTIDEAYALQFVRIMKQILTNVIEDFNSEYNNTQILISTLTPYDLKKLICDFVLGNSILLK